MINDAPQHSTTQHNTTQHRVSVLITTQTTKVTTSEATACLHTNSQLVNHTGSRSDPDPDITLIHYLPNINSFTHLIMLSSAFLVCWLWGTTPTLPRRCWCCGCGCCGCCCCWCCGCCCCGCCCCGDSCDNRRRFPLYPWSLTILPPLPLLLPPRCRES